MKTFKEISRELKEAQTPALRDFAEMLEEDAEQTGEVLETQEDIDAWFARLTKE